MPPRPRLAERGQGKRSGGHRAHHEARGVQTAHCTVAEMAGVGWGGGGGEKTKEEVRQRRSRTNRVGVVFDVNG